MFDVREKPKMVEQALLVGVEFPTDTKGQMQRLLAELQELVETLGIKVQRVETVRVREPKARLLMGTGKAEEIREIASQEQCDVIVFDNELSPAQQRNWETHSKLCVIDRQEVILDIFNERAHTREARLQVDLARAEYSLPRLKRAWTHLSRQRGGAATQRGEGEAQIELDQRMLRDRIAALKRELKGVVKQRSVQRKQRQKKPVPMAAIVGYTNAGKSSLLNKLTQSTVISEDKLFATLDPTTRRLILPNETTLLLTDTVGFVRRLPHRLVDAFKATLEEAVLSDFLIHVIDASSPEAEEHKATTLSVLKELGADQKRIITVYNKIDLLEVEQIRELMLMSAEANTLCISTHTGTGLDALQTTMEQMLVDETRPIKLFVPHSRYDIVAQFHQHGHVEELLVEDQGTRIRGTVLRRADNKFREFELH